MNTQNPASTGRSCGYVSPFRRWWMWVIVATFYCYENFLQVSPNVMNDDLRAAFQLSAEGLGNLGSVYFYAYAFMQIPVGILIDHLSVKRLLSMAIVVCALGSFIFGWADTLLWACVGRFLIGLGSAFAAVTCMQVAALWLPPKRFALMAGVMLTLGMLGAAGAQVPLNWLLTQMGWRHTMFLFGAIGLLLLVAAMIWMIDRSPADQHAAQRVSWVSNLKATLSQKQVWLVCTYGGLMFLSTPVLGGLWGSSFLITMLHISEAQAAHMIQYLFIGWAVGAPFFGWLSDRIQRRLLPMYIGTVGTFLALSTLIYANHLPILDYFFLLFFMGFFTSGFLPIFSVIRDISQPGHTATGLGFANTLNMIGPAMMQPLVGWLLDHHWQGQWSHGLRVYDLAAYHSAIGLLPVCVGLSFFLLPFIKETYCRPVSAATYTPVQPASSPETS